MNFKIVKSKSPISKLNVESKKLKAFHEGGHHLEKLEFALAVAQTRGDCEKSEILKKKIVELGGNVEEPGT